MQSASQQPVGWPMLLASYGGGSLASDFGLAVLQLAACRLVTAKEAYKLG
jgi:hypothetical protein